MTLVRDIDRYLKRTGMTLSAFGRAAVNDPSLVGALRKGMTIGPKREARIRAFMLGGQQQDTPGASGTARKAPGAASSGAAMRITDRAPPEPSTVSRAVAAEAEEAARRRRNANSTGTVNKPLSPAEQVVTAMVADPGDLIALVRRQWPDLWRQVIERSRADRVSPVAGLVAAIERGVAA